MINTIMSRQEQLWSRNDEQTLPIESESQKETRSALPKFETIKDTLWEKEAINNIYNSFEWYISTILEEWKNNFSDSEKNAIKIVLWGDFQNIFASEWSIGIFLNTIGHKIQSSLTPLTKISDGEDENSEQTLVGLLDKAWSAFKSFKDNPDNNLNILGYLENQIWSQILLLNKAKVGNPEIDFTQAYEIQKVVSWVGAWERKNNNDIFQDIISKTALLGASLEGKTNLWHKLAETIDNLPLWTWEYIKGVVLAMAPTWLKSIISVLMWEWWLDTFLSGENKKRMESLNNLLKLADNTNSPIAKIFPQSFKEDFDIESLEGFFKYLESEKIDHTRENFWEELLTGKTENENIKNLSDILKWEYGEKILDWDDTSEEWAWLAKKLNSLPKLVSEKENKERKAQLNEKLNSLPVIIPVTAPVELNNDFKYVSIDPSIAWVHENHPFEQDFTPIPNRAAESKRTAEITPEIIKLYTEARNDLISDAIKSTTGFPAEINYWDKKNDFQAVGIELIKTIDFQWNKLILGNKEYTISINDFKYMGKKIDDVQIIWNEWIKDGELIFSLRSEKHNKTKKGPLSKKQLQEAILWALRNNQYKGKIKGKILVPDIHYTIERSSWSA